MTRPGSAIRPRGAPSVALPTPDVYSSRNGLLHLRVTAEQVTSTIDGRGYPNLYTYATRLVDGQGTFRAGTASAYIGPQWNVLPGDKVIVDYINALPNIDFRAVGASGVEEIPQPLNLHTHGLTVAPSGNSDNVLLSIPPGRSNRYEIDIPNDQYEGLYWYHPHIHGITDDQVYEGLAGHIVVGRADGNYREFNGLETVPMMIRYNVAEPGDAGELVDASPWDSTGTALAPRGKMIYTVNGVVAPSVKLNAADGQHEPESAVWAFTNVTGSASYVLALEEVDASDALNSDLVGRPVDFTIVGVDGTPMPSPQVVTAGSGYLLGQGGRVAILVQGPSDPTKSLRLVQVQNRSGTGGASAYNWPAQVEIGGWRDYTRDVLAVTYSDYSKPGKHVDKPTALTPNYPVENHALDTTPVAKSRTFVFNQVAPASADTPNNFPVDFKLFPDNPIAEPEAGTVEEWTVLNYSSLHHPFHLHTQYGKVMSIEAPINRDYLDPPGQYPSVQYVSNLGQATPASYTQDVVNVPPALVGADGMPVLGPDGNPVQPGKAVIRVRFESYLGMYVEHCHRLPHEDRGMMSLVRTIPAEPVVALAGTNDGKTSISVLRAEEKTEVAKFAPFADSDPVALAVGDVDRDAIPDVAAVTTSGGKSRVRIFSGASKYTEVIHEFDVNAGGSIALGDLNADGFDDVVIGAAPGSPPRVAIFDGKTSRALADFDAFEPEFSGGVSVATGMVSEGGRISLIAGRGPGGAPTVNVYNFDLFGDAKGSMPSADSLTPLLVSSFDGADPGDTGGIAVTTGYPFAASGGFASIAATTQSGPGRVSTFSLHPHSAGGNIAPSGVVRPHLYLPSDHLMAVAGPSLDLPGPGRAAFVSTTDAAQLIVASGGGTTIWAPTASGFTNQGSLGSSASAVAGI